MHMNILSEKNNDKNYVKAKIQKGLQNPKYQEKLRNARLCNNDKNPIHLPRQYLPKHNGPICFPTHGKRSRTKRQISH